MNIKFYCDLYISECWKDKKDKILKKLRQNRLQPQVYIVTLSQGRQNHLEFFSSALLKQNVFKNKQLFVVAVVFGYEEALSYICSLTDHVYQTTGNADIRGFLTKHQSECEKAGQNK